MTYVLNYYFFLFCFNVSPAWQVFEREGEGHLGARPRAREKGEEELLPPPSFLACPLRFSLAPNPLSLPFRTPATKAIQNYTEPGSIKTMITSDQPLSVKQSLH